MSAYYEAQQWPPAGQAGWEHQTPPPARSGASSAIPREESAAFGHQLEEVDRAIENLVKSGKMFGPPGGRRELLLWHPSNICPLTSNRPDTGRTSGPNSRPHSAADFSGDARGPHQPPSNLQNFYQTQRHQSSRGSNEAEQMMQAKRRMAAQRERELRNYHQEQQYNRTVLSDVTYAANPDRTLSPGSNMSEEERRQLIAQQRSALYREGPFADAPGYVDETGAVRPGLPTPHAGPSALRGHSPLAYEYGRAPPAHAEASGHPPEGVQGSQSAGPNERSRANSNSSPQSNPTGGKGVFEAQSSRTSASSPGGSPPRHGVAPIGTRPSGPSAMTNLAHHKQAATTLPSPLNQGYSARGNEDGNNQGSGPSQAPSSAIENTNMGLGGWGSRPNNSWGNKSGLGAQASVWG
ncbi:hypothetical protein B0T18DRAFT_460049 [Schizothecium vesticola]|uniref:Uncharacterized protein n=1 Tax=Schizothecium vesticola TaxID=314040 RepID=A0AA40F0V2_9PEZI|nr:hypothetical protein B0T18DRAFT_460049 [Schizothecium vesticola]